ncbi:hypothetical protein EPN42_14100 [bacterium]|nr:MAG: hypothetical protein EPN42_14100 [bacterium]
MKPQYAEQRSLRDTRRGVALLGVTDSTLAGHRFSVEGVRVEALAFRDLALLVRPLRADDVVHAGEAAWMAREGHMQRRLCDRLAAKATLLPAKTGTIFASSSELDAAAKQSHARWQRALTRVAGKQEWLVLGYTGPHPAPAACDVPTLGRPLSGRRGAVAPPFAAIWETLSAIAARGRLVAAHDPRAAFAAALLVAVEHSGAFRAALLRSVGECAAAGATVYHAGPRAPFHFS